MKCEYEDHGDCSPPVVFTIHDARGCVDVCFHHARWRMETSFAMGHDSTCPKNPKRQDEPRCTGQLVHDEYTPCPVHDQSLFGRRE